MASAVANLHAGTNARFSAEAASWDSRPFVHEASKHAAEAIDKILQDSGLPQEGLQDLEIGCGTGILSFLMAKNPKVARIVAVDAAEGMVEVLKQKLEKDSAAKEKIVPVSVLLEDPEDPKLPSGEDGKKQKFDLITSHLVLHHIPRLEPVLETMYGCLKPGGCVMLTDFEDFGPEAKKFHPASRLDGVYRHGINAGKMKALMEEAGFSDVDVRSHWTMQKKVEKYDGEFGQEGKEEPGKGEMMDLPFVLCYGKKK